MTSKSELVELIQSHPNPPISGASFGGLPSYSDHDFNGVFSIQMKRAETFIHSLKIKEQCNPRIVKPTRGMPNNDTIIAIHSADVGDTEFHHLCKLFVQNKSPESVIFWLATWALCKNEITPFIQNEVLHFENDDTVAQLAYALAYHIKWPHRWEMFDAKIKHWKTDSRHAAHFVYVYEMIVDPLNKGSESYEAFMANNREGLFHATPYLGRTGRKNAEIENALYDLYQETGKKFMLDYAHELSKQGTDPVEHFRERVGSEAAHVISKELMKRQQKDRNEWFGVTKNTMRHGIGSTGHNMGGYDKPHPTLGDLLNKQFGRK